MYGIEFNGSTKGPLWGGPSNIMVATDVNGVTIQLQIYPDICNDDLRNAGLPMNFYYMPDDGLVRMAQNEKNKYMFHFTKFGGVLTQDSNIGVKGQEEVAGGVLSLTSTMELPAGVIDSIRDQIKAQIKQNPAFTTHPLYVLHQDSPPFNLGPVPIEENEVAVSNLTLNDLTDPSKQAVDDKWLWKMQGEGKGSVDPNGKTACTAMVGQYPAALIEAGFKGESSDIFVHHALKLRFRIPVITITVSAQSQKIYDAYSSNTKYKDDWTQANIHRAFEENKLSEHVKTTISSDVVLTDKEQQSYMDMAQQDKTMIMENIKKFIFDKTPDTIDKAEAADTHSRQRVEDWSFLGIVNHYSTVDSDEGYSYAVNSKYDASTMDLGSTTTIEAPYIVATGVSGNMRGFFQEIKANPDAAKEYFDYVNLGDAFKKIHVIATSRANWPDDQGNGDPVDKLAISVGYSDKDGVIQYKNSGRYYDNLGKKLSEDFKPAIWTKDDKDTVFVFDFAVDDNVKVEMRNQISIKRKVTFKMDDRVKVNQDNEIIVGDEITTDTQIEVKADVLGHLNVGPIYLSADLNKHMLVEVTFSKEGFDPFTLMFTQDNASIKQRFQLWTSESNQAIAWSYKVKVTYKSFGPLAAIQYEGGAVNMQGSFPNGISINLPAPPDTLLPQLMNFKAQSKLLEALDS